MKSIKNCVFKMDRLCHGLEQKCNSHSCDVCGKLYCVDCDIIGWYCDKCEKNICESCENIRKCNVCENELCNFCEEKCKCETNISRTSSRHLNDKTKPICDKECFDDLTRCCDCEEVYCMGHDYTGYCSRCDKSYCTDCREIEYCGDGEKCKDESLCENCYADSPMFICHHDCSSRYCTDCKYVMVCDLCRKGQCEDCVIDDKVTDKIYCCNYCDRNLCTICIPLQICGDCDDIVCSDCVKYCNEKCDGNQVHCKSCIPKRTTKLRSECRDSDVGLCDGKNKTCENIHCEMCSIYCKICKRTLCIDCHDGIFDGNDICKGCKSYLFLYKMNDLYKKLSNELVYIITNLIKV